MLTSQDRNSVEELLERKPFECERVVVFDVADGLPVCSDDRARELFEAYRDKIESVCQKNSNLMRSWHGRFHAIGEPGVRAIVRYYYGVCRVANVVVVVGKKLTGAEKEVPIDNYFLGAVGRRVADILGVRVSDGNIPYEVTQKVAEEGVFAELRALEQFEDLWRAKYGPNVWLAVRNGTVVAHSENRVEIEKYIQDQNIEPPVLYVPPKDEEEVLDIFSAGTAE